MKLNKLVIACGVLFAAGAGTQAFAADGKVHLYVSGASALEISVQNHRKRLDAFAINYEDGLAGPTERGLHARWLRCF